MLPAQVILTATHITIALSVLTFLLGVVLLVMKINKNYNELIAMKLDKEVFEDHKQTYKQHCEESKERFDQIYDAYGNIQKEQNKLLTELVKQYTEMKTDIKWIKEKIQ
jgi:uncharacterized membrane-anchored protein YhcB (DUF1043 family)